MVTPLSVSSEVPHASIYFLHQAAHFKMPAWLLPGLRWVAQCPGLQPLGHIQTLLPIEKHVSLKITLWVAFLSPEVTWAMLSVPGPFY